VKHWRRLAECAAECYRDENRVEVEGVEFTTTETDDGPVFAICGTNGVRDWFFNLHRSRTRIEIDGTPVRIHSGFFRAADAILPTVRDWARDNPDGAIVGHSLGAAVAIITSTIISPATPVALCAIAAPRVGDRAFVDLLRDRLPIVQRRIYCRRLDPICYVPRFGYSALPVTWLKSCFDGRLDHAADQYVALIDE